MAENKENSRMKFDILEHDQVGTSVYGYWFAPFSEEDWEHGYIVGEMPEGMYCDKSCEDIVEEYVKKLTEDTLSSFTSTRYTAQPYGEFENSQEDDENADTLAMEAGNILSGYVITQDREKAESILVGNGMIDIEATLAVDKIMEMYNG